MNKEKLIELLRNSKSKNVYCYVRNLFMPIESVEEKFDSIIIVVKDITPEDDDEFIKVIE